MFIYVTDSKNSKNPENLKSGQKSGSGIRKILDLKLFLKSDFKGGLWSKKIQKSGYFPQKSMFFAFFISASFCQVTEGLISLKLVTKRSKWPRVWPPATSRTLFFREKTGSGKSGKNPDRRFLVFSIRFWLWYIKMG